jgi:hypothetical protein
MDPIQDIVHGFGISDGKIAELRLKDGVAVYRVTGKRSSYILKYLEKQADRREIENYRILQSLGIPTLRIVAHTDSALLMEDVEQSATLRLGVEADMRDPQVMRQLAKWYKQLHAKGKAYVAAHGSGMYDETDAITLPNMAYVAMKTGTQSNPVWALLWENFEAFGKKAASVTRTLTYNDFYFTNLIVAKDASAAFMFDYNLLGKGYVYADIRNVTYALGKDAKEAFLAENGAVDPAEALFDSAASVLSTLYFACRRDIFPTWADGELEQIGNGALERAIRRLLAD